MEENLSAKPAKTGRVIDLSASTKGLDILISGSIILVFFLLPIFFTGLVAQGIAFEKMTLFYFLILIGVVAWVTKGVIMGELNIKRTPLDYPILALLAVYAFSAFFSISTKDSLVGSYGNSPRSFIALIIFILFYYLVVNNLNVERIKKIFWALIISSSLVVVYSILQISGIYLIPVSFAKTQSFNPLGSLSGLTQFLVMMLPLFVIGSAQIQEIATKLKPALANVLKIVLVLITLGALTILLLLSGFTFWPVGIISMVIVLMFFLSKVIKISNNNLLIPLFVFLALIILLVLGNFNIVNLNLPAEVSLSRSASWHIAKDSVKSYPILGSGPSTFFYSFSKFKTQDFNASPLWNIRFDNSSVALFEALATVGVLGAIAFVVLGLIALSVSFLTLIKTDNKEVNSILLGFFASFISALLFANLFSLNNSILLIFIAVSILSVSASIVMYPEKFKILKLSFRASPKYALALAAIFLCVSAGVVVLFTMGLKMYLADVYAKQSLAAGDTNAKIEKLNKAINLATYQDSYYLTLANNYMSLANDAAMSNKDVSSITDNLSKAIDSGKKAVEISPNNAADNESLALIYENASFYTRGALEWAEDHYNKVSNLDPKNPVPNLRIALVNIARSNAESDNEEKKFYINEAIKKYDEAIQKKEDLAPALYGKAIAYEKLGDLGNAIENLKKANILTSDNLDYRFELGRLYFNRGVTQPDLNQNASQEITENAIKPEGEQTTQEDISVQPTSATGGAIKKNDDLATAEQLFLSILAAVPNHANARYSLAVLYQKTGETENAKIMVKSLLDIVPDEPTKEAIRKQFPGLY